MWAIRKTTDGEGKRMLYHVGHYYRESEEGVGLVDLWLHLSSYESLTAAMDAVHFLNGGER